MLYLSEHEWLLCHGVSRFNARLDSRTKTAADIYWDLHLFYVAGGAQWRRVAFSDRPMVDLYLPCFRPELRSWRDLARLDFWEANPSWDETGDFDWPGGWLEVEFNNRPFVNKPEFSRGHDVIWRVAAADGARFTVELAGGADGFDELRAALELTLPDGAAAGDDDDLAARVEFWKGKAELYLIEEVPFGLVTVQVPRNARDPIAQALGQAKSLLGLGEPEHISVADYADRPGATPAIGNDLYVDLHYHGYYED